MFMFLIGIHVIVSIFLILVILLQAGRGGGLSETFGGGSVQTIFGTKTSTFLTRATTTGAIVFILTSLVLDLMASRYSKSVVEKNKSVMEKTLAPAKEAQETKETPKPVADNTPSGVQDTTNQPSE